MNIEHLRRGIEEFNNGSFFEAHDILEDLWMETSGRDKLFLQGLIQVSVGFYHFGNGNFKGAGSQLSKGLQKLEGYKPAHCGVELQQFSSTVSLWYEESQRRLRGESCTMESEVPKIFFE